MTGLINCSTELNATGFMWRRVPLGLGRHGSVESDQCDSTNASAMQCWSVFLSGHLALFLIPLALRLQVLGHQLFLQLAWRPLIMAEFHTELAFSLRGRAKVAAETE